MADRGSGLRWWWLATLLVTAISIPTVPAMTGLGWMLAIGLSIATFVRAKDEGPELRHVGWYRATLAIVLVGAALGTVAGASTIAVNTKTGGEHIMFVALSATNALLTILTWRALTRPSARRAAGVGMIALGGLIVAIVVDAVIRSNLSQDLELGSTSSEWAGLMGIAMLVSACGGSFACIASLTTFGERPPLPEARQIG